MKENTRSFLGQVKGQVIRGHQSSNLVLFDNFSTKWCIIFPGMNRVTAIRKSEFDNSFKVFKVCVVSSDILT